MKIIREFYEECSIGNCLHEIEHALKELKGKNSNNANVVRTMLEEAWRAAKEFVDLEYKEYLGDRVTVKCHKCSGSGYVSKYVGISCGDSMNASPYTKVLCSVCKGEGIVLADRV